MARLRGPDGRLVARPPEERFWSKVDRRGPDECWLWTASQNNKGYGRFGVGSATDGTRRVVLAHRFSYELLVGPIPEGLTIDHVKARGCMSTLCVNPAHLEPVTHAENVERGEMRQRLREYLATRSPRTHCRRGHPFDAANTRWRDGWRRCRECDRATDRRKYARHHEKIKARNRARYARKKGLA